MMKRPRQLSRILFRIYEILRSPYTSRTPWQGADVISSRYRSSQIFFVRIDDAQSSVFVVKTE